MQLDYFDSSSNALSSGFPEKMMLFDCETTGGNQVSQNYRNRFNNH